MVLWSYLRVLFRSPGSPRDPETSTTISSRIPIQPEQSIMGTTSAVIHNESDPSLKLNSASASSSKITSNNGHQMTHQSDSLNNKDVIQPMKNAHLRTSPNPLPTIQEVGTDENHDTSTATINVMVNGCVGHRNYKFFYLFIFYTSFYADFAFAATIPIVVQQAKVGKDIDIQWIVLLILAFLFGILLSGFTVVHTTYIFQNRTTIESISVGSRQYHVRIQFDANNPLGYGIATTQPGENLWDLGWRKNFKAAMGSRWWLCLIPIGSSQGDGLSFPYNSELYTRLSTEAKRQAQLEDRIAMMMHPQHYLAQEIQGASTMAPGATSRMRRY
ncbi:14621_t:CDS:2 [Ambispora leptoticha]|uniref:Palmitoyltransferase n=1 Tax=Ambispora leptoticha TaxID=144679 RepID=A0A9N8ZXD3_9GLOM|nr:14621_t:CDS:2 [Ambispora leptoticha]